MVSSDGIPRPPTAPTLLGVLEIEELDTDLYRGLNETVANKSNALFGGQVAAQCLRAAAHTVPEGRLPHSLHGYFLRPGRPDRPVLLHVARDHDGKSFSARAVDAKQDGQVIFSMLASFQTPEEGVEFDGARTEMTLGPDELPDADPLDRFRPALRVRPFPPVRPYTADEFRVPSRMWARTVEDLPDDPLVHACALTYLSDVGSGFANGAVPELPRGGPSVDHAIWFHHPVRLDDWVLLDMWPLKAFQARGLYAGAVYDREGRLGAMLCQELLFRRPRGVPKEMVPADGDEDPGG